MIYKIGNKNFNFADRTFILGVINVTPDSFSDGGKYFSKENAISHALNLIKEGADFLDIGGESTRPKSNVYGEGAEFIPIEEELKRVIPVIRELKNLTDIPISIDTYKSEVAGEALKNGAKIVNDISGFSFDEKMIDVIAANNATAIAMHIKGTPKTMQQNPEYKNVVKEVYESLENSVLKANTRGIKQLIIDPGIGFGKNLQHNLTLLNNLEYFKKLNCPIMVGTSNKSFIGQILDLPIDKRKFGNAASVASAILNGANIVRVHNVRETKEVCKIVDEVRIAKKEV